MTNFKIRKGFEHVVQNLQELDERLDFLNVLINSKFYNDINSDGLLSFDLIIENLWFALEAFNFNGCSRFTDFIKRMYMYSSSYSKAKLKIADLVNPDNILDEILSEGTVLFINGFDSANYLNPRTLKEINPKFTEKYLCLHLIKNKLKDNYEPGSLNKIFKDILVNGAIEDVSCVLDELQSSSDEGNRSLIVLSVFNDNFSEETKKNLLKKLYIQKDLHLYIDYLRKSSAENIKLFIETTIDENNRVRDKNLRMMEFLQRIFIPLREKNWNFSTIMSSFTKIYKGRIIENFSSLATIAPKGYNFNLGVNISEFLKALISNLNASEIDIFFEKSKSVYAEEIASSLFSSNLKSKTREMLETTDGVLVLRKIAVYGNMISIMRNVFDFADNCPIGENLLDDMRKIFVIDDTLIEIFANILLKYTRSSGNYGIITSFFSNFILKLDDAELSNFARIFKSNATTDYKIAQTSRSSTFRIFSMIDMYANFCGYPRLNNYDYIYDFVTLTCRKLPVSSLARDLLADVIFVGIDDADVYAETSNTFFKRLASNSVIGGFNANMPITKEKLIYILDTFFPKVANYEKYKERVDTILSTAIELAEFDSARQSI